MGPPARTPNDERSEPDRSCCYRRDLDVSLTYGRKGALSGPHRSFPPSVCRIFKVYSIQLTLCAEAVEPVDGDTEFSAATFWMFNFNLSTESENC